MTYHWPGPKDFIMNALKYHPASKPHSGEQQSSAEMKAEWALTLCLSRGLIVVVERDLGNGGKRSREGGCWPLPPPRVHSPFVWSPRAARAQPGCEDISIQHFSKAGLRPLILQGKFKPPFNTHSSRYCKFIQTDYQMVNIQFYSIHFLQITSMS